MKYLNHYTVNTTHNRKSYAEEVDKKIYLILKSMINKALNGEKVDIMDGVSITLTAEEECYVATFWLSDNTPILITFGAKSQDGRKMVSDLIAKNYSMILNTIPILPEAPVVADVILPGSIKRIDVLQWSGDFCRCLGWIMLDPNSVRY